MSVERLKNQLLSLRKQILNWQPDTSESQEQERFSTLESQLKICLEEVVTLNGDDRVIIEAILDEFRDDMQKQYAVTKQKLDESREQLEQSKRRVEGLKAYNKKTL